MNGKPANHALHLTAGLAAAYGQTMEIPEVAQIGCRETAGLRRRPRHDETPPHRPRFGRFGGWSRL